ncbi:MAG: short chain dehydrogenase [Leptothrix sp. (in: Bacteria)]|nr:short chain dehydrogenase [Leptothrix sp. (in: b-proteobacteria)]
MNILVVGASRGLGLEFVVQYRAEGALVTATARRGEGLARLQALGATALCLDVADADSVAGLAAPLQGAAFDLAIVNAGVYGPRTQGLVTPSQADFDHVMHTNVLGAMRVLPLLAEVLAPGARLAVLSSRMGAMRGRSSNAGWLYRASKAALNSLLTDTALALAGRATCVALHPGWVRTDMGGAEADLDPVGSVADMRRTLAALTPALNGAFLNHDGTLLPW